MLFSSHQQGDRAQHGTLFAFETTDILQDEFRSGSGHGGSLHQRHTRGWRKLAQTLSHRPRTSETLGELRVFCERRLSVTDSGESGGTGMSPLLGRRPSLPNPVGNST